MSTFKLIIFKHLPLFSTLKCQLTKVNWDANILDVWSITKKIKILILPVTIIVDNLFFTILKKDGLVVKKLSMIGMSSRNFQLALLVDTLTKNRILNFISQTLSIMQQMHWKNKSKNQLSSRISTNTIKVIFLYSLDL